MAMTAIATEETSLPQAEESQPFSTRLRAATACEHGKAEAQGFITSLMSGDRCEADYWVMMAQYLPIYEALEESVEAVKGDNHVSKFYDERLNRVAAIKADFAERFGTDYEIPAALPAAEAYAARIRECSPIQLLAHHYLRYLGDLSGGQAIGALVARHYQVPAEQLNMWDFSDIDSPKRVKDAYRAHLDEIVDPGEQEAFLEEAREGYRLATQLFAELGE